MVMDDGLFDESLMLPSEVPHGALGAVEDDGLERVATWFFKHSDLKNRFSAILRKSIDEVLDGQRTGRYNVDSLAKTEKTYLGTKVEIICQAEFGFPRGERMDYEIAGQEVDAKFSLLGQWMIPREAMGHLCLLISASDAKAAFNVGLIRIREKVLNPGRGNQDGKRSLSKSGRHHIRWLVKDGDLLENLLLRLDDETRRRVLSAPAGQRRVDQLFREVQGRLVDRNAVVTTAKQLDAPKRVRDARIRLAGDGFIILGHQSDSPRIASSLGLPVPVKGTWVSARLVPAPSTADCRTVLIGNGDYIVAGADDPPHPAPKVQC